MPENAARIVVHDYSGHPGQAELSRALARRGYDVEHQYCPSYTTGRGAVQWQPGDPENLRFQPVPMTGSFQRYAYGRRVFQELAYGWRAAGRLLAERTDVVVVSNVPLLGHGVMSWRLARAGRRMIFWHQDIYSAAIGATARQRVPVVGALIAWAADRIERGVARRSDAVVAISPTFLDKLGEWGVSDKSVVVPNWAPIGDIPVVDRRNPFSEAHALSERPVVLYAGTLGLKHDPSILALIADALAARRPGAVMVVASEGRGREWLEQWKRDNGGDNLVLLDFQPYEQLPMMLGSADVLLAVLEPDASRYSVPSKVLTYLCAGRAVVGVLPPENSVGEILAANHAGVVVDPGRRDEVASVVVSLLADAPRRDELGAAARRYAEETFSVERAADRFEAVFAPWLGTGR